MAVNPSEKEIKRALILAGSAHHEYEQKILRGVRDTQWAGWYAAYVLGHLGNFTSPSLLTRWIEKVPAGDDWFAAAAAFVFQQMKST